MIWENLYIYSLVQVNVNTAIKTLFSFNFNVFSNIYWIFYQQWSLKSQENYWNDTITCQIYL